MPHAAKSIIAYVTDTDPRVLPHLSFSGLKRKNGQHLPIGPAPNMATFLPGPTPALLHACTARSKICVRTLSHALQNVYSCLTSGTCPD